MPLPWPSKTKDQLNKSCPTHPPPPNNNFKNIQFNGPKKTTSS